MTSEATSEQEVRALPSLSVQAERLIATGVLEHEASRLTAADVRAAAAELEGRAGAGALLVASETALPVRILVPSVTRMQRGQERPGFVVVDMEDLEEFLPTVEAAVPDARVYAVEDPSRGDGMRNWSPAEASEAIGAESRTPFTVAEGVHWALQVPEVIDRNACFMTIGSRRQKKNGFDSRTPALWISNGTGRDGRERRGAVKLGWCWWNNRHTWLGFASGSRRVG
ncbi:DUF5701 family protein [Gordonia sp. VNK21]|uniref:DUF5701 family protein n=1 Tax=Gordonia sp. VNK21 TaxID=3382483 RepID=UPI0038D498D0